MNSPHRHPPLARQDGSVFISGAISAAILSVLVAGTLSYVSNQHGLDFRSHHWTQALHLAEAGVEAGFAELNYPHFRGAAGFRFENGWEPLAAGEYTKSLPAFTNSLGRNVGEIAVTVDGVGTSRPAILGVGRVTSALRGPAIARGVRVTLAPSSRFPMGMVARQEIDLRGNRIYTDSFDSADPSKSTNGAYDLAKRQPNGDIATNGELRDTVNVGNADIYGVVRTGASGQVAIGSGGSVGATFDDTRRATSVTQGEAAGWITHDFATDIPSVSLPAGLASANNLGNLNSPLTISAGSWRADSIQLNGSKVITIDGTVRLYVTGNISISGTTAGIVISPGGRLEIYAAGSVAIAGNGVVNNSGNAANNQFYGLPSSTSWTLGGNGQWVGTIYAPQANLTLNGGGTSGDMSGGLVANRVTLNGQVQFHYDEALRNDLSVVTGYIVTSWQALRLENGAWVGE